MVDGVAGFTSVFAGVAAAGVAGVVVVGVAGVAGVAGVVTTGVALLTLTLVLFALLAASGPQAIPRALRPKTADNTNAFVILIRLLSFSKLFNPVSRVRLMKHNRFDENSFFFSANVRIERREAFVNLKSLKKSLFFIYFFTIYQATFTSSHNARIH